ncbi:MAG: hypothetical protein KKA73_19320 [Chloroflexi bacterium]|nr:hypothetical protein [Chloroflexota bacterium]MBU1749840.1 hypothetical protein [Chloroflexota bacterium]MBU1877316.1 hypothetical protein [Chloroflexota bacterium]
MNVRITVSEQTAQHLQQLPLAQATDVDSKLRSLLGAEYRRRLSRYSLTDRRLRAKYGMPFDEFERQEVVKQRGYSWDVESDAVEWDLAVSGIRTMHRALAELLGTQPHDDS